MFGEILSYIYSGTLHVSLDKVQPLYQAADLLQLDYVRDTCSSYMFMNVERSTCVDLYKFADVFSLDSIRKTCLKLIHRHFVEFSFNEEFCSLSVNQLAEIISQDELDVKEETTVWEAVVRWVQHSREDRLHHLPSILPHIRFNLLTSDDTAAILEHPLVRENPGGSAIRNAVKGTSNLKKRFGMDTLEMALLFTERSGDKSTKEILWTNPGEGKHIRCNYNIPQLAGTVTRDNDIYLLAQDSLTMNELLKYNHIRNEWEHMSSVRELNPNGSNILASPDYLKEIDGQLFYLVVTSSESHVVLRKYDQETNRWHTVPHTSSTPNGWFDQNLVVSCNRHIYLFTETEIHCYNPRADQWCRKNKSDNIQIALHNAVAIGREIFCIAMSFDKIMVYDTETDSWCELPGWLNTANEIGNIALFAIQKKLHAVVDYDGLGSREHRNGQQAFVYDGFEGVWKALSVLPEERWYMYDPMIPVARMYLPYLNPSPANTEGAGNTDGRPGL
ncbi:kelch repeat and BTB domain-containing protein 2-like isoform X1 [Branchiostoma floridae]|uniref:Kelch repeat and BTB domain-containing protein 2-like isoform X1 n=1 Tax=Branchiostoma floridae TaxID=7739 RepID=A0A9J7MRD5_BRAFL|nr:kelch repeat and BTB domain-containing protein 2-like isoform X1 [Branchiostoma floridae]